MKKQLMTLLTVATTLFVACSPTAETKETVAEVTEVVTYTPSSATTTPIAYIDIDSLIGAYDLYHELRSAYEIKSGKIEKELTAKSRSFEKDVLEFQEKVEKGLITRAQAATMEQTLQVKQQAFVKTRDAAIQELGEEESVMLNNIQYNITEYLKEFNADKRYGVIISTAATGPVLNADPSLNITAQVIDGLNKKHANGKKK